MRKSSIIIIAVQFILIILLVLYAFDKKWEADNYSQLAQASLDSAQQSRKMAMVQKAIAEQAYSEAMEQAQIAEAERNMKSNAEPMNSDDSIQLSMEARIMRDKHRIELDSLLAVIRELQAKLK